MPRAEPAGGAVSQLLANVTCVAIDGRGIVIEGEPGSGKTSLALALIDRGAKLVGDDGFRVEIAEGRAIASPPPGTAGMIEVRNVGLVELPATRAPIALVLRLTPAAPRFPLTIASREIGGLPIPCLDFCPGDAIQALRAEFALGKFGLTMRESRGPDDKVEP